MRASAADAARATAASCPAMSSCRSCAASAAADTTLKIVPSAGSKTASYASSVARLNARATWSASAGPASTASANARRIWARMTPELPRAPTSDPLRTARATAGDSDDERSSAATTASIVITRFVPVSESATGKTLAASINAIFQSRFHALSALSRVRAFPSSHEVRRGQAASNRSVGRTMDQPRADALAGLRSAAAAAGQWHTVAGTGLDRGDHILFCPRQHDAAGDDLEDAGIGGVERAREAHVESRIFVGGSAARSSALLKSMGKI